MPSPFDLKPHLQQFAGTAPLFPLPNCVFFPHILLPLHIFEPRYRRMTEDALAGDRLIALALQQQDHEPGLWTPGTPPPIHRTVCLGRIIAEERLSDGRFYLVLQGLSRAVVRSEVPDTGLPYRVGQMDLVADVYPVPPAANRESHWQAILSGFRELFPDIQLDRIFQSSETREIPLGVLCDVLAYALKLTPVELQAVLEELDVDVRSALVTRHLRHKPVRSACPPKQARPQFPPKFSRN